MDLTQKPYNLTMAESKKIQAQVASLSLDEKIGQLFFVIGQEAADLPRFIKKYQPGGLMYRPDTAKNIAAKTKLAQKLSPIPPFLAANLESGGNGLLTDGSWVSLPLGIAATNDPQNAYQLGAISGQEAAQVGGNMAFAPIADIDMNFRNPITNTRTFGSDPKQVLKMVQAQIRGLNEKQVIPVIKHFPGDGVDERDQHLVASVNSLSKEAWMNSFGHNYRQLIEAGAPVFMIGHIMQPAWERFLQPEIKDSELRPASSSKPLIAGLLREVLGFQGLAITDATPMIGYNVALPREELLPATINAGIDMILFNKNIDEDIHFIKKAIANGILSMTRVDEAVTRILATKVSQKIMTIEGQARRQIPNEPTIDFASHQATAATIADQAVTLVKDRDQILPLTPEKYPHLRLVVLGDHNDGGFNEGGSVTALFQAGLEKMGFTVSLYDHNQLDFHEIFEEGVADLQEKFDLCLYVANVETASNQTTTRLDWIHLMAADAPWFMKSIPTVFVSTANPYHLFDIPAISTYINAYTGNPVTVQAVLEKLSGQTEFLGKSPVDPFCGDFTTKL